MAVERTFSGDVDGLRVGQRFVVITSSGSRLHQDTAKRETLEVVRIEAGKVVARPAHRILEKIPIFTAFGTRTGERLWSHG